MAIEYTGDDDPRKLKAALFFSDMAESALKSLNVNIAPPWLISMKETAAKIKRSVKRRKSCTDKQLQAIENCYKGIRRYVHGSDA